MGTDPDRGENMCDPNAYRCEVVAENGRPYCSRPATHAVFWGEGLDVYSNADNVLLVCKEYHLVHEVVRHANEESACAVERLKVSA